MIPALGPGKRDAAALAGFQHVLGRCSTASDRKRLVLTAWECGALGRHETRLLVEAYMLETARWEPHTSNNPKAIARMTFLAFALTSGTAFLCRVSRGKRV